LSVKTTEFERNIQSLRVLASGSLVSGNVRVKGMYGILQLLSPENVLHRGYTITSLNGRIIKRSKGLNTEDIIDTQFIDGRVKSKVIEKRGAKRITNEED
jgi:exodeoxyribonuclease VII large subunit